ncbi:diguanylate cyclase (GGDEF)-like protein [Tibeticola sediminis]|uniref:Diguanylate cyclase (GGDEF)-like protein n=1 Tax=Tibeticola sediminis TaxID=1917811 RepID=A0A3N4UIY7_9BURK|nr:EAL domain-containing protein [Tibeticola sediminis]RPE65067.1 diguanylate cyclase (GGDEF)-like protein [Tibeticola sediminis]
MATPEPPVSPAPLAQPVRPRFRRILVVRFLGVALALLLAFLLIVVLVVVAPLAQRHAEALFSSQTQTVRAEVATAFDDVGGLQTLLIADWQANPPTLDAPEAFIRHARGVMAALPAATSVVLGNERGQGWLLLWRADRQEWWLRLTDRERWGDEHRFVAFDPQGQELRRWRERLPYDPRERPWYRLATGQPGVTRWTHPYVFYTTREPGITAARAWRARDGSLWALGFDLRVQEIQAIAERLSRPLEGRVAIVDTSGDEWLGLAGAAVSLTLGVAPSGEPELMRLDAVPDPVLRALVAHASDAQAVHTAWITGQPWLWTRQPVALGKETLTLFLAAPWMSFLPPLRFWMGALLLSMVLAMAAAAVFMRRWALELSGPIETLADAAHRMAALSFTDSVRTDYSSAELHTLARALNHLRRRLAVYTARLRAREVDLAREVAALRAAEQRLLHIGLHDALTDLPNRRLLMEHLQHALARADRGETSIALLFIDLDRFKEVNDTRGHEVGDELLRAVALRLLHHVRAGDLAARLGGDEFVLLLEGVSAEVAIERTEDVLEALRAPLVAGGERWSLGASIGIALGPRDGADPGTLLRHADEALYRAKAAGRNRWVLYERGFSQSTEATRALRVALEAALQGSGADGLELWWQPQIALDSGEAVAAEGLLRWRHPQRGLVPPAEFIPLAEDAGLMPALGWRVLDLALAAAPELARAQPRWRHVAVNVSARQLELPDFADQVLERLARTGWPAERLELEVTESVLLESAKGRGHLERLAAHGVRLSLDDFGTGYSSLSYLRQLPFDVVKIDASFVRDLGTGAQADSLVEALIAMAKALGLELVAEGVETEAQRAFLAARGVDLGQGYLWSRPQPLAAWLGQR